MTGLYAQRAILDLASLAAPRVNNRVACDVMSSRQNSWPWLELGGGTEIKENNIPRKKTFSFNRGGKH